MKNVCVYAMVLSFGFALSAFGQKPAIVTSKEPGWHKIGEITASFEMDTESIVVFGSDEFSSIKLRVTDAPIHIERVQVLYESGEVEDVEVKNDLQAGAETRSVDLQHANKEIEKVTFTYETSPNYAGEKAHVELYGFKPGASDAYRDDEGDAERAAEDAAREIDEETDEARREIDEETDEAEKDAERTGESVKDGLDRSTAVIGAEIKDKVYAGKMGPGGETIYIDKHSKYYYINKEGSKVFITKLEMKDKPKDDN